MTGDQVSREVLLQVIVEIKGEIRCNGISRQEKAQLFHGLGSIYGLIGQKAEQKSAWQQAQELDPESEIIRASLKSLE